MGVLSDLIIADRTEATSINKAGGTHRDKWICLASKGVTFVTLGTLWAILSACEIDPAIFMGDPSILDQSSDEGPWVLLVPPELVSAIADLDETRADIVAKEWAKTEEFPHWSEDLAIGYFRELIALARKAQVAGKDVLLWMSL